MHKIPDYFLYFFILVSLPYLYSLFVESYSKLFFTNGNFSSGDYGL